MANNPSESQVPVDGTCTSQQKKIMSKKNKLTKKKTNKQTNKQQKNKIK